MPSSCAICSFIAPHSTILLSAAPAVAGLVGMGAAVAVTIAGLVETAGAVAGLVETAGAVAGLVETATGSVAGEPRMLSKAITFSCYLIKASSFLHVSLVCPCSIQQTQGRAIRPFAVAASKII